MRLSKAFCLLSLPLLLVGTSLTAASVLASFRDCSHFFHKRTPPVGLRGAGLRCICQRFGDQARYATLYDGGRRLALYSAYVFKKSDGQGRAAAPWMYEPQLVSEDGGDNMRELPLDEDAAAALEESQAVLEDYTDAVGYERGPLNPDQHQADTDDKSSTYTLTNVVPQATAFLDACWNPYLDAVRRRLNNFCHGSSYVVTGATVSGSALRREKRERVAIPKHLWLAYCCPWFDRNSPHEVRFMFPSYGSYALNQATGHEVAEVPVKDLESFLTRQADVGRDLAVFPKGCVAEDLFRRGKRQNP